MEVSNTDTEQAEEVGEKYYFILSVFAHVSECPTDLFKSVMHEREDISHIEKISYLRLALQGKALVLISTVPFGDVHYVSAWKELNDNFDNPCVLGFSYLDKLLGFSTTSSSQMPSLQLFVTTFSEMHAAPNTLNIPNLGQFILFRLGARNIDFDTLSRFEETLKGELFPSVCQLINFVKQRIKILHTSGVNMEADPRSKRRV
jgi:hypothetical protein